MKLKGLVLIVLLLTVILAAFGIGSIRIGYYTEFDFFGPISRYALYFFAASFLPALIMVLMLRKKKVSPLIAIMPFLLLVFFKYVLPDLLETFYITNFSDSPVHIIRGLFVTKTGHSDPGVDPYFDLQSGFFWITAMFLNIVCGVPSSIMSSVSLFLAKWFHLLALAVYLPLLYFFYEKLLHKPLLVGSALLLQFAIDSNHYHYAAQSYGNSLYWFSIALALLISQKRDRRLSILFLFSCFSLFFLHQGLTIFLVAMLFGMLFYPLPFRFSARAHYYTSKKFLVLLIIVLVGWFSYLIFSTGFIFDIFVTTLREVLQRWLNQTWTLVSESIQRPNLLWMQVVTSKAAYMAIVVFLGLILSFINAWKSDDDVDKAVFTVQLFTAGFIGFIAIALGGAGYIERLFIMLPLTTYSIIRLIMRRARAHTHAKWHIQKTGVFSLTTIALATLIFLGMTFYFSGRNFQSRSYSEQTQLYFIVAHDPNSIEELYTNMRVSTLGEGISHGFQNGSLYLVSRQGTISSIYYVVGESSEMLGIYSNFSKMNNQIYDNLIAQIMEYSSHT